MKPLAIVTTHPIQYQAPLFRRLAQAGIPLRVLFLNDQGLRPSWDPGFRRELAWDIPLLEGYEHLFLRNWSPVSNPAHPAGLVNPRLLAELSPSRYSAVLVHGYRSVSMLLAMLTARSRGLPVLYRAESPGPATRADKAFGRAFRHIVDACLAIGTANRRFYSALGLSDDQLFIAPYAVDNSRFQEAAARLPRSEARARLRLPADRTVVAFVGKLVPWKQPDVLLEAFRRSTTTGGAVLVFAGDGELRGHLENEARQLPESSVRFLGFMNQSEVPLVYKSADLLVLPSLHEPWGLVVNEAMNFGVPALVSDRVGCAADLVLPGTSGAVFRHDSTEELAEALSSLLSRPNELRDLGDGALERINRWGFDECVSGFKSALDFVARAS